MNINANAEAVLRSLLNDMFEAREHGVEGARFARAQGYADGYMRALMEAGLATQEEVLRFVLEERSRRCVDMDRLSPAPLRNCRPAVPAHS